MSHCTTDQPQSLIPLERLPWTNASWAALLAFILVAGHLIWCAIWLHAIGPTASLMLIVVCGAATAILRGQLARAQAERNRTGIS